MHAQYYSRENCHVFAMFFCHVFAGILSGDRLAFLDPHERYFEASHEQQQQQQQENSGHQPQSGTYFLLSDPDDRSTMNTYPDQFAPFSQVKSV